MTNEPFQPKVRDLFQLSPLEWQAQYRARLATTQAEAVPIDPSKGRPLRGHRRRRTLVRR
jgi:hypothetical protein